MESTSRLPTHGAGKVLVADLPAAPLGFRLAAGASGAAEAGAIRSISSCRGDAAAGGTNCG